jgi:hypothetical protein
MASTLMYPPGGPRLVQTFMPACAGRTPAKNTVQTNVRATADRARAECFNGAMAAPSRGRFHGS